MTHSLTKPKPLIAGNWKMNGLSASRHELDAIIAGGPTAAGDRADLLICPPATLLAGFAAIARGSVLAIGGQDCHPKESGAHTGDISAEMLKDAGATAVIVGHSERRADHGETNELVRAKAEAALRAGLTAVVCVGETRAEREANLTLHVVASQVKESLPAGASPGTVVIAYEPVWAIGTGLTPTVDDVAEVHAEIRGLLIGAFGTGGLGVRVLYGGSVKPGNAAELLAVPNVDGALIGGASLLARDFLAIAAATPES